MGVATDQLNASLNEIQQLQEKKTIVFSWRNLNTDK